MTAGEDGLLKQWSRSGNLRSKLAQVDCAIYDLCWSPDNQAVLYTSNNHLTIKPLRVSSKQTKWKAHNGVILSVDWNSVNNLIVSGSEDCKYKVWDSYGRQLYCSSPTEFPYTSIKWCPNGQFFAAGSFNVLSLCDKTGWVHSRGNVKAGSIMALDWTADGTHVAGAGASGAVVFGQIVDRHLEWKNYEIRLNENNQIVVRDVINENSPGEELEFGSRVIEMSVGYNQLIVATTKTCYVYTLNNLATPHVFDVKGTVTLILQSPSFFALVSTIKGIQVYSYEGRIISNPRVAGIAPQLLQKGNISLSDDALAVISRTDPQKIHILDIQSGKTMCDPIKHNMDLASVALSPAGLVSDRKVMFIDSNRDLYIGQLHKKDSFKICSMVDSAVWNDDSDILAACSDSKLIVWYYPNVVYVDKDLLNLTKAVQEVANFGKTPQLVNFVQTTVTVRRTDGAYQTSSVSPFPAQLFKFGRQNQWERCTRLCRYVRNDNTLWACLAAMAIHKGQLDTAEVALAAIDEVEKLTYIQYIKTIPSQQGRQAELMIFKRKPTEAENILLQAKLVYRAIMLNINAFNWDRALELARQHKTHVDTVLGHRQKYLQGMGREESDKTFLKVAAEVSVDWSAIKAKAAKEEAAEKKMGTAYKSKMGTSGSFGASSSSSSSSSSTSQSVSMPAASSGGMDGIDDIDDDLVDL